VALIAASPGLADELTGTASVIDGDTLEIHGQRIRMHGVDAPESSQTCTKPDGTKWRCGQKAGLALQDKINKRPVTCTWKEKGKYGRLIGTCKAGGENLNEWLAENGWAMAYRKYSTDYVKNEEHARAAKKNIWNGEFEPPNRYRQRQREHDKGARASGKPPGKCAIKGNISRSGNRIYHLPSSEWYAKTRINEAQGEKWFCTEAEAKAAGFRPAQPSDHNKRDRKRKHGKN
jgi:endonuclease YncB( thermonuclease family)